MGKDLDFIFELAKGHVESVATIASNDPNVRLAQESIEKAKIEVNKLCAELAKAEWDRDEARRQVCIEEAEHHPHEHGSYPIYKDDEEMVKKIVSNAVRRYGQAEADRLFPPRAQREKRHG